MTDYIDRNRLIRKVSNHPRVYVDAIDYSDLYDIIRSIPAADAIEELSAYAELYKDIAEKNQQMARKLIEEKPRWIPVTERLPDAFKHVLVNIPGMAPHPTVQEAFREKNGLWYSNGFRYGADEITHWMPLPEPPKEE